MGSDSAIYKEKRWIIETVYGLHKLEQSDHQEQIFFAEYEEHLRLVL